MAKVAASGPGPRGSKEALYGVYLRAQRPRFGYLTQVVRSLRFSTDVLAGFGKRASLVPCPTTRQLRSSSYIGRRDMTLG